MKLSLTESRLFLLPLLSGYLAFLPPTICQLFNFTSYSIDPTVTTNYGPVTGRRIYVRGVPVDEFIGIPFAKPPIGQLRFQKPQRMDNWMGAYPANNLKPFCPQPDPHVNHSEDCLYLNIWRPANVPSFRKLPVFHWIHGGGFVYGSAMESIFNASAWPALRDVIIVTQNYRLNVFGFFNGNRSDAPGNVALWDQVAALTWVKENIGHFGGNSSHVTLMGQSAGSASVGVHLISPVTDGLFHRAIMMSGSSFATLKPSANIDRSFKLAEKLNCRQGSNRNVQDWLSCLRQVPYQTIIDVISSDSTFQFSPNFGDSLYPWPSLPTLNENAWNSSTTRTQKVDLLSGLAAQEGTYVLFMYCKGIKGFERSHPKDLTKNDAKECIKKCIWNPTLKGQAADYYTKDIADSDSHMLRLAASQAIGDFMFTCPTHFQSQLYAQGEEGRFNNVYSYHITYKSRYSYFCYGSDWAGVCHGDELYMLFGDPIRRPNAYNASDITFSEQLIHDWTYFGINGNPPNQLLTKWPSYRDPPRNKNVNKNTNGIFYVNRKYRVATKDTDSPLYPNYMELNPNVSGNIVYNPYPNCRNFWKDHMSVWDPTNTDAILRSRAMAPPMSKMRKKYESP